MNVESIHFGSLDIQCCLNSASAKIAYILYPMNTLNEWLSASAETYGISIVVVTGIDWDNDLTPWAAGGVPAGTPGFKGLAPEFLEQMSHSVMPVVERKLECGEELERTLIGVSLSGLFTLWQWPQSTIFRNIATLSGSFWYDGFVHWLTKQTFSEKTGLCYMCLGQEEPHAHNPVFRTVGVCTEQIVSYLKSQGVDVTFEWVPGNHYQHPIERLNRAFSHIYIQN